MKKRLLTLVMSIVFVVAHVMGQQKTVTGRVTSAEDGMGLPGVSVKLKGATGGTSTDANGNYSIKAQQGQVLVFAYVGTNTEQRTIGAETVINVALKANTEALNEVVVTAFGIKQEKRKLGYSVQDIKGADVAQSQRTNFLNSLQGRVAGARITSSSGAPGSSSQIVLRGISSIEGDNQPLFVVDGIPVSNNTLNTGTGGVGISDTQNRYSDNSNRGGDINPDDIESITILKGAEAAALYGIDAGNGAIIITTKKGQQGKGSITYDNAFSVQKLTRFIDFQTKYSNGTAGETNELVVNAFGAPYPEGTKFYDNYEAFFETGYSQKHNLTFSGGTDKYTYRLSGNYLNNEGVVPNTSLERINFRFSGSAKLSDKFEAQTSITYIKSDNSKVPKGAGSYVFGIMYWPRTDDVRNYLNPDGTRRLVRGSDFAEMENPFFNVNMNSNDEIIDRTTNNFTFIYTPAKWLSLTSRTGIDYYSLQNSAFYHPESNRNTGAGTAFSVGGTVENIVDKNRIVTSTFLASAKKTLDDFDATLMLGGNIEDKRDDVTAQRGQKLLEPNFNSINNTDIETQRTRTTLTQRRMVSVFGQFNASYKNLLHLGITGRKDWSSTLPVKNRTFFYPSVNLAFEFTELDLFKDIKPLSFGKLRISYAEVGKDAPPYYVTSRLEARTSYGGGFSYGFYGGNPDLRPEKTRSYEIGGDVRFFKGRLGLDVAYYSKTSIDQIVANQRVSYATGFILKLFNGGKIKNYGTEILLTGTPIKSKDFTWDVSIPFTKNDSKVLSLPAGQKVFYLSDTDYGGIRSDYVVGGTTTALAGEDWIRNDRGDILLDPTSGNPIVASRVMTVIGDRNPEFTVGWQNNLYYKNVGLSFLFDIRKGGDVFNATGRSLSAAGLSPLTVDNRLETRVIKGVLRDGLENTDNPTYSTIAVLPQTRNAFYSTTSPVDWLEKVNYIWLKDVTLSYKLPKKLLDRQKTFSDVSLFVTGTDLFLITNYTGADPNTNSLTPGIGGNGGFGVDYGALPTPATYNFGLRVSLK